MTACRTILGLTTVPALWLTALALLAGCSGQSQAPADQAAAPQPASGSPAQAVPSSAVLAQLPSPSAIGRQAGMIGNSLMCWGSNFRDDLSHQNVTVQGNDASFSPVAGGGDARSLSSASFAIYDFDLSSLMDPNVTLNIVLKGTVTPPDDGSTRVFAGLGWGGSWHWGELAQDTIEVDSWSWGVSQSLPAVQTQGGELLPAVIVVFGNHQMLVNSVKIEHETEPLAAGPVVFRKGWDGTIKGRTAFDGSVHVVGDDLGRLHVCYYDSSNGQLYYMRLQDRVWTTEAADCNGDVGLFNDLTLTPSGGLLLPYMELPSTGAGTAQGAIIELIGSDPASMIWSPRSNFDTGADPAGGPSSDVGGHCSVVFDAAGIPNVFYEDATHGTIKRAYKPAGAVDWLTEVVSQPGEDAYRPVAMRCAGGVCCAFVVNSHTGPFDLVLAQQGGPTGWFSDVLATDAFDPDPRDAANPIGFCDGSVRPGTDEVVIAYSSNAGVNILHRQVAARNTLSNVTVDGTLGGGVFVKLAMLGDGSVCVSHFNPASRMIAFIRESPSLPAVQVPAVQLPEGTDCDDQDIWVSPGDIDGDGFHDLALVVLSSKTKPSAFGKSKELTGHVTLIK